MAKVKGKTPIPRTVPTEKEAARQLSVAVRRVRAEYGTGGDAVDTRIALADNVAAGKRAVVVLKRENVPQTVVTYYRGMVEGLKFAHGIVKDVRPSKARGGQIQSASGKRTKQRRGSIV